MDRSDLYVNLIKVALLIYLINYFMFAGMYNINKYKKYSLLYKKNKAQTFISFQNRWQIKNSFFYE